MIVVDNSLSMAYTPLDQSLLELGRAKVEQFIRALPSGSDVTLIPMCPQPDTRFADVYDSKEDSLEAVARIRVVDRMARLDDLPAALRAAAELQGTVRGQLMPTNPKPHEQTLTRVEQEARTRYDRRVGRFKRLKAAGRIRGPMRARINPRAKCCGGNGR